MPGRPRKPTFLKSLEGTIRQDRINENEPKPKLAIPKPPAHLDVVAMREWRRLAQELFNLGLLSNLDVGVLAMNCVNFSRWVEAEKNIQKMGAVILTPNGCEQVSPWVGISQKAQDLMRKTASELGLTPASRPKISAKPLKDREKSNPFDSI